jgi:hypothetical protein
MPHTGPRFWIPATGAVVVLPAEKAGDCRLLQLLQLLWCRNHNVLTSFHEIVICF